MSDTLGTAVHLDGLRFAYPGAGDTVRDIDLELPAGRITAVLGPSGCGKTTLLKLVAGLLQAVEGHVRFDGRVIDAVPAERRAAVLVPQEHLLFPHMSVLDNVAFGLRMRGVPSAERRRRAAAMLAEVRLHGLGDRRPAELSGGQRQRAALARALVVEPRVLLLDEPLASLDADLRVTMRSLIRQVQRSAGVTTLLVTHDRADALALADQVAVLLDGRIRQVGAPATIYRRPSDEAVARLLGPVTLLPAQRSGSVLDTPLGERRPPTGSEAVGPVWWALRPEEVLAVPRGEPGGPAPSRRSSEPASARMTVEALRFAGDHVALRIAIGDDGRSLEARLAVGAAAPDVGEPVQLLVEEGSGWLLPRPLPLGAPHGRDGASA